MRVLPYSFRRAARVPLVDLTCCFHTPPTILAVRWLCLQSDHSPPSSILKTFIFSYPFHWILFSAQVANIVTWDNADISSLIDESPECLNKAMSYHTVCFLYVNSTTAKACEHCAIPFVYLLTLFDQKWPKHFYITVDKRWFLYRPLFWKDTHLLLTSSFAINTFRNHLFHISSTIDCPESIVPYFIYCYSSTTMSIPSVIKANDDWHNMNILRQQYWMLQLILHPVLTDFTTCPDYFMII